MQSLSGLIVRLERAEQPDRRLDSEVVAAVLGPPGCIVDMHEGLDGWDLQLRTGGEAEPVDWREASDIPGVTAFLDAACEVVAEARPHDAAKIIARALRQVEEPVGGTSSRTLVGKAARTMMAELIRTVAMERVQETVAA
jgi:hypothetical protein